MSAPDQPHDESDPALSRTTLFHGATVFTGEAASPTAEAFAVQDGRFLAAGTQDEVRAVVGPDAVEEDLHGAFVLPGFWESHVHMTMLGQALDKVSLRECATLDEIQQRIAEARAADPQATQILGASWYPHAFAPGQQPTAAILDAVVADIPVILDANSLHAAWVNTAGLAALGITRDTPDPLGGQIVRDADGEPTGLLLENAAIEYAWGYQAAHSTEADQDRFLDNAFRSYLASGTTGATDMGFSDSDLAVFRRRLERDGRLPFPVDAHWMLRPTGDPEADLAEVERVAAIRDEMAAEFGTQWLRIVGVKLILDGVIDACTAAMRAPYVGGELPDPLWEREAALRVTTAADARGLQLALHAIGDQASTLALDLVEECVRVNGPREGRRPRVEHLESVAQDTIERMAQLGVTASMQPVHCDPAVLDNWKAMLGDDRAVQGFPWHRFREAGVPIALGTDAPTAPHQAARNLFIALTARSAFDAGRDPYQPERVFDPADALEALTSAGARASGRDGTGRIAAGLAADFCVLDLNPLTDDPDELLEMQVLRTVTG